MQTESRVKRKRNPLPAIIIFLVGLVLSMIVAAMYISESRTIDCFYNTGEVYETTWLQRQSNGAGWQYRADENVIEILDDEAAAQYVINRSEYLWQFLSVTIDDMNASSMTWNVECYDSAGNLLGVTDYTLQEGKNQFQLPVQSAMYRMIVRIKEASGLKFRIQEMQFREQISGFTLQRFVKIVIFCEFLYGVGTLIIYLILKKIRFHCNLYIWVERLQDIYIHTGQYMLKNRPQISEKWRHRIITWIFAGMILYLTVIFNMNLFTKGYQRHLLLCAFGFAGIDILSMDKKLHKVNWKNIRMISWLVLILMACISDFLVTKIFSGAGFVMLFCVGMFFFIWHNSEKQYLLLEDFMKAVHITFIIAVAFCVICRPESEGCRYMGLYYNPNTFADYLNLVFAVVLATWTEMRIREKGWQYELFVWIEGVAVVFFAWKTQSRGNIIAMFTVLLVCCVYWWIRRKELFRKNRVKRIVIWGLIAIVQCNCMQWAITNLPHILGTRVIIERDIYKPQEITWNIEEWGKITVEAASTDTKVSSQSRFINSFRANSLEQLTSGRTIYWKEYLRQMNLFGHPKKGTVNGKRTSSHNGFLDIAHRYGVFIVIPYLLLWGSVLIQGCRYMFRKKRSPYEMLPFIVGTGYFIVAMSEPLEQPFSYAIWIGAYSMMGVLMQSDKEMKYEVEE